MTSVRYPTHHRAIARVKTDRSQAQLRLLVGPAAPPGLPVAAAPDGLFRPRPDRALPRLSSSSPRRQAAGRCGRSKIPCGRCHEAAAAPPPSDTFDSARYGAARFRETQGRRGCRASAAGLGLKLGVAIGPADGVCAAWSTTAWLDVSAGASTRRSAGPGLPTIAVRAA